MRDWGENVGGRGRGFHSNSVEKLRLYFLLLIKVRILRQSLTFLEENLFFFPFSYFDILSACCSAYRRNLILNTPDSFCRPFVDPVLSKGADGWRASAELIWLGPLPFLGLLMTFWIFSALWTDDFLSKISPTLQLDSSFWAWTNIFQVKILFFTHHHKNRCYLQDIQIEITRF